MQFILSKVLYPFLLPITWLVILMLWALSVKNHNTRKKLLWAAFIILILFSEPFILDAYARLWDYPQTQLTPGKKFSCVIVLGGFSGENRDGDGYFDIAADRFIEGVELVKTNKAAHILITGGDGSLFQHGYSEGRWARAELHKLAVPDSLVLIEGKSRNTIENALFSKKLLETKHLAPPYLLVTSAFHMRRSILIFKKAGIDVIPYPANYLAGISKTTYISFIPSAETFSRWNAYTKELVGIMVAKLRKF